jgi:tetratricopeptide (TPR) repeat protein
MRPRTKLGLFSLLSLAAVALAAVPALAVPPKKAPPAAAKPKEDPEAATHKQFLEAIKDGSAKYTSKDVAGAIEAFRKATDLEPRNPVGYYYLGEAQLGNTDLAQAETAWLHASQVSEEGTPALKGKIFFVIADLRERQKRWDDAKAAWTQYGELAAKYADAIPFPNVAKERIASIEAMQTQDKAYDVVRKRIAEENAKKAAGQPVR